MLQGTTMSGACFTSGVATGLGFGAMAGVGSVVGVLYLVYRLFKVWVERG
jgi:hypothetical protein